MYNVRLHSTILVDLQRVQSPDERLQQILEFNIVVIYESRYIA